MARDVALVQMLQFAQCIKSTDYMALKPPPRF